MRHHRPKFAAKFLAPILTTLVTAGALGLGATPAQANFVDVAYACGYYSNVTIGTFSGSMGCPAQTSSSADADSLSPAVKDDWSNAPLSVTDSDGARATYGPAHIFSSPYDPNDNLTKSGPLSVDTWGSSGAGSSVNAKAKATGVGPSPFWTQTKASAGPYANPAKSQYPATVTSDGYVESSCTASSLTAKSGTTTILQGFVDTAVVASGPNAGYPATTVAVPSNPAPNYRVDFTIDNVGDSGYLIFNEQIFNLDGSLTVNGAHEYMLGPTAKGDLIIAQTQCGRVF